MTSRACPSCRRAVPGSRDVCPRCLAALVDDLDATITCPQCGAVCPVRRQTCSGCFALLRAEDVDLGPALALAVATGTPLPRPAGRVPFAIGPGCTVRRLAARSSLVLVGADGFVEATVNGPGIAARPPLDCGLFCLQAYAAVPNALVAMDVTGAPLATFLRSGRSIDVRDETSAPVARIERAHDVGYAILETGGTTLGTLERVDVEHDGWIDDQWTVAPGDTWAGAPLRRFAWPALAVSAKVLWGRPEPVPSPQDATWVDSDAR